MKTTGRAFWKSLEEYAATAEFRTWLEREFPVAASEWEDPDGRRRFLKLMGASMALAGLGACTRQPAETIVPYVTAPEQMVPGRPLFYSTAVRHQGFARGVLVETHMGRPTKVEGNPEHPASLGATDIFAQAEILSLYDPDRSQTLKYRGEIRPFSAFVSAVREAVAVQRPSRGAGIRVLTETVTSPTFAAEMEALKADLPDIEWHAWEASGREHSRAGASLAFGEAVETRYVLDQADVVVCLDADFMTARPDSLALIRAFVSRRRARPGQGMNRLYAIESTPSLTGASADHRLPLLASEIEAFARALASALAVQVESPSLPARQRAWISAIAGDLREHSGSCVVMAGENQPPFVHALAHAINDRLGNAGHTVFYTKPVEAGRGASAESIRLLAQDMNAGKVSVLLVLGGNPVYTAPADLDVASALGKVPLRVHVGLYEDETAAHCHWHVPAAHDFETWGDVRALDGTVSIQQPLIEPLYGGKSPLEVLATLSGRPQRTAYEIVREHWRRRWPEAEFERAWRRALHDGVVAGTELAPHPVSIQYEALLAPAATPIVAARADALEIFFQPDPTVHDGRHANNGWLQELPKPLTKLTWGNAALISPKTADRLQMRTGDVVRLTHEGRSVAAPVCVTPGHADGGVTVHLGYGRVRAGRVGNGAGFSAYALRTSARPWFGPVVLEKTNEKTTLAVTQDHWSMEGRPIVRVLPIRKYEEEPESVRHMAHDPKADETLYPPFEYEGHAWGMAIDLGACVGCNACIAACQSENNIPVVGKDQVARGREMHWLRVDRYYRGDPERSETIDTHFAPVPCMHCENAPCETVCPVAATVHSDEGLNDMVYNRCVGTKYCSNNCPYKVRRFNFYLYQDWDTPSLKLGRNPDVTVRSRGVMEKCTYCVQRINEARINAKNEGRPIRDGDIKTACQQACPAQAIVFGDIGDARSEVSRWKAQPRNYGLLTELNTRPRTTYLAALRNPNPQIPREDGSEEGHRG